MRPRALINLINHCRGVAINLRKPKIEESDFLKGLEVFSNELLTEIALEIRDVMPEAENVLYQFIGTKSALGQDELKALILQDKQFEKSLPRLLDVLFWHGVLGLVWLDGRVEYIYHAKYNVRLFRAQIAKAMEQGAKFQINPAFWPVLGIS
jgi:hypothetical protein